MGAGERRVNGFSELVPFWDGVAYVFSMAINIDQITDDLLDNADFEEVSSVTKAKAFITAAKRFLILTPAAQSDQASSLSISVEGIERLYRRAQQYVDNSSASNGSRVRFLSASEGFRR